MTFRRKAKLITVALLAAVLMFTAGSMLFWGIRKADAELNVSGDLKEEYLLGATFVMPEAEITVSGEAKAAAGKLIFPSGAESVERETALSEYGKYTLSYSAEFSGKTVTEEVTFFTVKNAFENIGNAEYKEVEFSNPDYLTENKDFEYSRKGMAIVTDFPSEENPLIINQYINVAELGDRDPLIRFGVPGDKDPEKSENLPPYANIFFKFTDAGDPSVYFEVRLIIGGRTWYYAVANSSNTGFSWENHIRFTETVEKGKGVNRYPGAYADAGAYVIENVHGLPTATIIYDKTDNAIYAVSEEYNGNQYKKVADFDDPEQFDFAWGGFKSDNVILTVGGYTGPTSTITGGTGTGKFAIEVLGGKAVDESYLTATVRDTNNPVIEIDYEDYAEDSLPMGMAGETYPVFEAKVFDDCAGTLEYNVQAFYNYGEEGEISVPVENGSFKTDKIGRYTLVYTAEDYSGNVSTEYVNIDVFDATDFSEDAALDVSLDKTYIINDKLSLTPSMTVGGKGVTPFMVMYLPDGSYTVLGSGESFTLADIGLYNVRFIYQNNDKVYKAEQEFFVVNSTFDRLENAGDAKFGEVEFINDDYLMEGQFDYERKTDAIVTDIPDESNALQYALPISLDDLGARASLIKFGIPGNKTQDPPNGVIFIKVADAENPGVYFEVRITVSGGNTWYYMVGNSANEFFGGEFTERNGVRSVFSGKSKYPAGWADCGGAVIQNIYGLPTGEILYEPSTNSVYTLREEHTGNVYVKIADFGDSAQFANQWQGFPSGRVTVSVYHGERGVVAGAGGNAQIAVESIGGNSAKQIVNESSPALEDAYSEIEFGAINGHKGVEMNAEDYSSVNGYYYGYDYTISNVIYNWYSVNEDGMTFISSGKAFTPENNGLYALEIEATDFFDRTVKKFRYFGVSDVLGDDTLAIVSGAEIQEEYPLNAVLTIPEVKLFVNDESAAAEVVVYFPDGRAYSSAEVLLDMPGVYTIEYAAVINGLNYVKSQEFTVLGNMYSTGNPEMIEADEVFPGGIKLTLQNGDTVEYGKTVNLNQLGDNRIFDITARPQELKTPDFSRFVVRLTDAYDADNWVEIVVTEHTSLYQGLATYSVKLPGQPRAALNNWNNVIYKDSEESGAYTNTPFAGNIDGDIMSVPFGAWYDPQEKVMYCYNPAGSPGKLFIADLDDTSYFTTPFKGFTTGEVRISLRAENFASSDSSATVIVSAIGGESIKGLEGFTDNISPIFSDETGSLPSGAKGLKYTLPEFSALDDFDGFAYVNTRLYYNYYSDNPVNVLLDDMSFVPRFSGTYTAVYSARDSFGNVTTGTYDIEIEKNARKVSVILPQEKIMSAYLGENVKTASVQYYGGYGSLDLSVTVKTPSGKEISINEGDEFFADEAGTYTIKYNVTDYHGQQGQNEYNVEISASENPVFSGSLKDMPRYLILNDGVNLPVYSALIYEGGELKDAEVEIWIKDFAHPELIRLEGNYYVPVVEKSGDTVEIVYYAVSGDKRTPISVKIPVIDTGYKTDGNHEPDILKFFTTENAQLTASETGVTATLSSDGSIEFINPVLAPGFLLRFGALGEGYAVQETEIRLTDSSDSSNYLSVFFIKDGEAWKMRIGSGEPVSISSLAAGENSLSLSEDLSEITVNGESFSIEDLSGGSYKGFPDKMIYIDVYFAGVQSESAFTVTRINTQNIGIMSNDITSPDFYTEQLAGGMFEIGSEYTLKPAYAADVLDSGIVTSGTVIVNGISISGGLTVRLPDRQYAVASDGTVLNNAPFDKEYVITLDQYGIYSVSYTVNAAMYYGSRGLTFTVSVTDTVAPTVSIDGDTSDSVKVNKTVRLPGIIAEDNLTETDLLTVQKFVISPDDIITVINEETIQNSNCMGGNILSENSIRVTMKGVYRILYRVVDEAGNIATAEFTVNVR